MAEWQYCTISRRGDGKEGRAHIYRAPPTSKDSTDLEFGIQRDFEGLIIRAGELAWELVAVTGYGEGERWHFKRPAQG